MRSGPVRFGTVPNYNMLLGEAREVGYDAIVERAKRAREEHLAALREQGIAGQEHEVRLSCEERAEQLGHDCPHMPNEDEIAQRAASIRAGWTEAERLKRAGALAPSDVIPSVLNMGRSNNTYLLKE